MKKTVAIVLLVIHLFNIGGYMAMFQYLINRSNEFVEHQISKDLYNVKDLVEVKIPVHMPQIQNWTTYERVSGQVQLDGACYNYVKLKVTQDTLFIMCIPNYKTTHLTNANFIYARHVSDVPLNKKGNSNTFNDFSVYKCNQLIALTLPKLAFELKKASAINLTEPLPANFGHAIDQPPRAWS